jgi:hypothetical protein
MKCTPLRAALSAVLFLCAHSARAAAQAPTDPPHIGVGMRVRASVPERFGNRDVAGSDNWQSGMVRAVDDASITLQVDRDGSIFRIPVSEIRALEVSQGTVARGQEWQRDATRSAVGGAILGGVVTGVAFLVEAGRDAPFYCNVHCSRVKNAGLLHPTVAHTVIMVGGGALVGGLIGTVMGNAHSRERWLPVNMRAIQLDVGPSGGAVAIRF